MDSNLMKATNTILLGIDNGWDTEKIKREVYKAAPVFKTEEHLKYMYGILVFEEQVILTRVETRALMNVVDIVFSIEK